MFTVSGPTDRVVVVGAGLAGLSAAMRLAGAGREVVVLEREDRPGGRAGRLEMGGYSFDTGPTVLTMPDLIEDAFAALGEDYRHWLDLIPLDPAYRAFYPDGSTMDVFADPERISRLMLVCSSPRFIRASDWPHAMLESTLHQFADALKQDHRQTLARFLSLQVQGDDLARETLRLLRQEIMQGSTPDPQALEHGLKLLLSVDLRTQLHQLQCPSFWLLGEKDALVPGSVVQELALLAIPQAEFECLKGCAHAPFISHPARSLALVKQFFGTADE